MSDHEFTLPMNIQTIEKCLPHRYPFLLVDRVTDMVPGEYIKAYKNVSTTDPFLQGHFPGNPVVPGVLLVEGIAQASGILGYWTLPDHPSTCMLTEIVKTRFRRPVVPGDVLEYHVRLTKKRGNFFWFDSEATVDGGIAAQVSFSAQMK